MYIRFKNKEFCVNFSYEVEAAYNGNRRVTTCVISEGHQVIAVGRAECSPEDNFDKRVGRRLALSRALSNARTLPGEEREAIFNEVCKKVKQPVKR